MVQYGDSTVYFSRIGATAIRGSLENCEGRPCPPAVGVVSEVAPHVQLGAVLVEGAAGGTAAGRRAVRRAAVRRRRHRELGSPHYADRVRGAYGNLYLLDGRSYKLQCRSSYCTR